MQLAFILCTVQSLPADCTCLLIIAFSHACRPHYLQSHELSMSLALRLWRWICWFIKLKAWENDPQFMLVYSEIVRILHWPQHTPFPGGHTRVCRALASKAELLDLPLGPFLPWSGQAHGERVSLPTGNEFCRTGGQIPSPSKIRAQTKLPWLLGSVWIPCDTSSSHPKSQTPLALLSDSC